MNILLINNESEIQRILIKIIEKWRGDFMAVTAASDALCALRVGTFDLISTEPAMLDIRNKEIQEKIREGIKRTQVIVVGNNSSVKTAFEFIESGVDHCFMGPFSTKEIGAMIEDLLRTRKISELNEKLKGGKGITKNNFRGNSSGVVRLI